MRKVLIALVACIAALVALAMVIHSGGTHPQSTAPLPYEEVRFDFGRVRSGTTVHHDFDLPNKHDTPLAIDGVTSNCGCTVPGKTPEGIPPHSSVKLPVDVHLKGAGPWETKVVVTFTNRSWITVYLDGNCVLQVPPFVSFEGVLPGQSPEQRFTVHPFGDKPIHVKSVQSDSKDFDAFVASPSSATGPSDPEIVVRVRPDAPVGQISSTLHIETDDDEDPVKQVALSASILPRS